MCANLCFATHIIHLSRLLYHNNNNNDNQFAIIAAVYKKYVPFINAICIDGLHSLRVFSNRE